MTQSTTHQPQSPREKLLTIIELPVWMRDNDFLHGSYRPPQKSLRRIFYSAFFTLHNDTINIWSHGIGFLFFLSFGIYLLGPATSVHRHLSRIAVACTERAVLVSADIRTHLNHFGIPNICLPDKYSPTLLRDALSNLLNSHRIGLLPLVTASVLCLAFSTIFHAFWIHSPKALRFLGKLDFLGISFLITGHALSGIYYLFYCTPKLSHWYYALVIIAQLATIPAIFAPSFGTPAARAFRVFVFCSLASTALIPLAHAVWIHSVATYEIAVAVGSAVSAISMYVIGAVIYISRFPECCRVGMHDRFFASHQLMHIAVLLGVGCHMFGCWTLLEYRMDVGCSVNSLSNLQ